MLQCNCFNYQVLYLNILITKYTSTLSSFLFVWTSSSHTWSCLDSSCFYNCSLFNVGMLRNYSASPFSIKHANTKWGGALLFCRQQQRRKSQSQPSRRLCKKGEPAQWGVFFAGIIAGCVFKTGQSQTEQFVNRSFFFYVQDLLANICLTSFFRTLKYQNYIFFIGRTQFAGLTTCVSFSWYSILSNKLFNTTWSNLPTSWPPQPTVCWHLAKVKPKKKKKKNHHVIDLCYKTSITMSRRGTSNSDLHKHADRMRARWQVPQRREVDRVHSNREKYKRDNKREITGIWREGETMEMEVSQDAAAKSPHPNTQWGL